MSINNDSGIGSWPSSPGGARVTIAIPTYNRAAYLGLALESALAQTYTDIEIIVSDNASSDDTARYLAGVIDARLKVVRQVENIGMMENWNACLDLATGKYFLLLSDDDLLESNVIQQLVSRFECPEQNGYAGTTSEIGAVYCQSNIIDSTGSVIGSGKNAPAWETNWDAIQAFFLRKRQPVPCSVMVRTEDARSVGGYSQRDFPLIADTRLWMEISLKRGVVGCTQAVGVQYRVHTSSTTNQVRVESWLADNKALANYCLDHAMCVVHDPLLARRIKHASDRFNIINAALLISANGSAAKRNVVYWYLSVAKDFLGMHSLGVFFQGVAHVLVPVRLKEGVKRLFIRARR